jgi:hypothetical protein
VGRLHNKGVEFVYGFGESVFRYMEDKSIPLSLIQNGLKGFIKKEPNTTIKKTSRITVLVEDFSKKLNLSMKILIYI